MSTIFRERPKCVDQLLFAPTPIIREEGGDLNIERLGDFSKLEDANAGIASLYPRDVRLRDADHLSEIVLIEACALAQFGDVVRQIVHVSMMPHRPYPAQIRCKNKLA